MLVMMKVKVMITVVVVMMVKVTMVVMTMVVVVVVMTKMMMKTSAPQFYLLPYSPIDVVTEQDRTTEIIFSTPSFYSWGNRLREAEGLVQGHTSK